MTAISSETETAAYQTVSGRLVNVVGRHILTPGGGRVARVARAQAGGLYGDDGGYLCRTEEAFAILPDAGDRVEGNVCSTVLRAEHAGGTNLRVITHGALGGVHERVLDAGCCDPRTTSTAPADSDNARELAQALAEMWQGRKDDAEAAKKNLDNLVSDAHEWADDNSLCETFDNFMESHDLPPRRREYEVTIRVNTYVTLSREARNEAEAGEDITTEDVWAALQYDEIGSDEWEIDETSVR